MRNWSAILIDAGLRNLSVAEVAREQRCYSYEVVGACERYAVQLGRAPRGRRPGVGRAKNIWTKRFADLEPGLTLNAICQKFGCSWATAENWAKRLGYKISESDARRVITAAESTSA